MPKETIQFPAVDGTISTETSVRWTREEQGGHVQLCVTRYPYPRNCINGCDGVNTGCSDCPPSVLNVRTGTPVPDAVLGSVEVRDLAGDVVANIPNNPVDRLANAVIGSSRILSAVLGEVDPTQRVNSTGAFGSTVIQGEPVIVDGPPRVGLGGAYMLPPIDNAELAATEPDGSVVLWTDPLDRNSINKLIKVLRRARDQAYGQDE